MAKKVSLACSECGSREYSTTKKDGVSTRLEMKKFCRRCNTHTMHRESK
ncbi:50S ribosomal protein L33 [Exiguobacterium sp. B2(2022)]|nr:50S ribosomal protein L33 [Exiguobacterium sp. B2(2022)]MDE0563146.1 50S ribosomal protein L33 [Exiguobacterium sp. B2(2022)]